MMSIIDEHDRKFQRSKNSAGDGIAAKGFPADLLEITRRKLLMIHRASVLNDLRIPPANRRKSLKGNRAGRHAIRVNDQFRICFTWRDGAAHEVEFVDYHR